MPKKYQVKIREVSFIKSGLSGLSIILGVLLCFTIVGILPGIGFAVLGIIGLSKREKCPNCNNELLIPNKKPSMKCKECGELIMFEWAK